MEKLSLKSPVNNSKETKMETKMEKQMLNIDLSLNVIVDPETNKIVDYTATLNGVTKKITAPKKVAKKSSKVTVQGMMVERQDTKLSFSQEVCDKLGAEIGDKIDVSYVEFEGNQSPYIMKSESGNKLSKTLTTIYRGKKNDKLKEYGTKFAVTKDAGGYRLIGDVKPTLPKTAEQAIKAEVDLGLSVTGNTDIEIEDMDFNI